MLTDNKLYTWVDVQDSITDYYKANDCSQLKNINFRTYWDGLNISYALPLTVVDIEKSLEAIFLSRYGKEGSGDLSILLEGHRKLPVFIEEVGEEDISHLQFKPSLSRPSFIGSKETVDLKTRNALKTPIIYAFHSFKGGVGRTLHTISMALNLGESQKVLLIDADFEAPGISWLVNSSVSFADLLALIHSNPDHTDTVNLVAENLQNDIRDNDNLYILPAFRSLALTAPNLEIKPEHVYRFDENPFVLTDILVKLAEKLSIDYILIDLRAGVSELSTGWFFDPRINKVFVTTLSSQSILGTSMMFRLLSKFEIQNQLRGPESPIPSLIISQVPKSSISEMEANWTDTYSSDGVLQTLRTTFAEAFINVNEYNQLDDFIDLTDEQIIGRIIEPITLFSEEYDSLKSLPDNWESVIRLIRVSELDKKLSKIADITPINVRAEIINKDLGELRQLLKKFANKLIFAEAERQEGFLQTESIKNLIKSFYNLLPVAVVVGAKGSGKTFLYKQIGFAKDWQEFGIQVDPVFNNQGIILPVTLPANLQDVNNFNVVPKTITDVIITANDKNIWQEYIKPDIELSLKEDITVSQWREKWFDYISWAAGFKVGTANVGREFISFIQQNKIKIVAIFDGLEDLFKQFNANEQQQRAIESLLQDVPTWLESQVERNLGAVVFVRRDIITAAIPQNSKQFLKKYENFELKWNVEEALRLIHWVLNKYVIPDNPTFEDWEKVIGEKSESELIKPLYRLWGMRMAKDTSKEAYSHNWILGSLANLKKEIQSRDIIRFLDSAVQKTIDAPAQNVNLYNDRILIPTAIRESIDEVGQSKIEEVSVENQPLKVVLEILQDKTKDIKFPCKLEEMKSIISDDRGIRILEDNGVIVMHNGEYYMAELYRKGMGFEYSRKGRPKVLYF